MHYSSIDMIHGSTVKLGEALGALAAGHICFSGFSVVASAVARRPERPSPDGQAAASELTKVVSSMYGGRGLDPSACAHDVTFTGPAACCAGTSEVVEAFRALAATCRPEHVDPPLSVRSARHAGLDCTEFFLHQRYFRDTFLLPRGLVVRSVLVVHTDADTGRVRAFEERWNGVGLLQWVPFRWVRRINGMLSSLVTPYVAR